MTHSALSTRPTQRVGLRKACRRFHIETICGSGWRRSEEGHVERGEPRLEKGGKGGKGGVTPPPPPPKWRQEGVEGGDAPPAVKAKGGDTPPDVMAAQLAQQQALEIQERHASQVLAHAGYPEFPDYVPSCGGTSADTNPGRLTVAATKKLMEGLCPCQEPDADIANALMASFLRTRKGLAGEDLSPKLGSAVAFPGNCSPIPLLIAWTQPRTNSTQGTTALI